MSWKPWVPKTDPACPDMYQVTVFYIDGKTEEIFAVSHHLNDSGMLTILDTEDQYVWIPLHNVKTIKFGKEFSNLMAARERGAVNKEGNGKNAAR